MTRSTDIRHPRCTHASLLSPSFRNRYTADTISHRWFSDVSTYSALDNITLSQNIGPTFQYEYSTREAYGANITGWGLNDPLNATWWHLVTERTCFVHYLMPLLIVVVM